MSADLGYIRREIPIEEVAAHLCIERFGTMYRCFRPEAHQNGDRTPSMGKARTNRVKCFVCDPKPLSTLDLVMKVCNCKLHDAVEWIRCRFDVPATPKGKHIDHPSRWSERERIGTSASSLEYVIRSFVWASLSQAEKSLLPVLDMFADPATHAVQISYQGMMRYSGIGSRATISSALRAFEKLHLIQTTKAKDAGLRACGAYVLTFNDPDFIDCASSLSKQHHESIALERELRSKARDIRRQDLGLALSGAANACTTRGRGAGAQSPPPRPGSLITGNTLSTPTEPVSRNTVHPSCTVNLENAPKKQGVTVRQAGNFTENGTCRKA